MAKNTAEQLGEALMALAVRKGRAGSLIEDRAGLQAERAARVQLVKRRANRAEPGGIDDLDQKLAGHVLSLPLGSAGLRERGQLAPKLVHAVRVEHVVFEDIEVYQLAERTGQFVRSAGERRPS